ncbi:hypothetical protein CSKR_201929 [Clonorchis sinensis]|uniref:C2H2-type domain-containing protein n=1 Tax=Clonorchis sinensis TaxID=79923 RepID=A0A8T1MXP3_CLOSI|nr:hypothetical protein CSKR_201929 [Clonorchis sinensis]
MHPEPVKNTCESDKLFCKMNKLMDVHAASALFDVPIRPMNDSCVCSQCGDPASDYELATLHQVSRHRHVCAICGLCLLTGHLLSKHELQHSGLFPSKFVCPLPGCGQENTCMTSHRSHVKMMHRVDADSPILGVKFSG